MKIGGILGWCGVVSGDDGEVKLVVEVEVIYEYDRSVSRCVKDEVGVRVYDSVYWGVLKGVDAEVYRDVCSGLGSGVDAGVKISDVGRVGGEVFGGWKQWW